MLLAPPNYHLLVENGHTALSAEEPVGYARPSIDVLFDSAASSCGASTIGVVLTGTGTDGAAGLAAIRRAGGVAIVQCELSAAAAAMPVAALAAAPDALVLPLPDIAPRLVALAQD